MSADVLKARQRASKTAQTGRIGTTEMMDFEAARIKMVDNQIRTTDVTSYSVLNAFHAVPREAFVPARLKPLAYIDDDIEIAPGRFLMEASRSEEHTSELQSLMSISYAVFCLKKKKT